MKTNETFLRACKDKNISSLCIFDRFEDKTRKQYLQLSIPLKTKYNSLSYDNEYIYSDTSIRYEDYSRNHTIDDSVTDETLKVCFHIYPRPHLFTFLKTIKKDSEVSFKVIAFDCNDNWEKVGFVSHQIYGIVDDKY